MRMESLAKREVFRGGERVEEERERIEVWFDCMASHVDVEEWC